MNRQHRTGSSRPTGRGRRALAIVLLGLACALPGHAADGPAAAAEAPALTTRLQAAIQRSLALHFARDIAGCHALLAEMRPDLRAGWSTEAFALWEGLAACDTRPGGPWEQGLDDVAPVLAAHAEILAHFAAAPLAERLRQDFHVAALHRMGLKLRGLGPVAVAAADRLEARLLDDLVARASASPPDALALSGLRTLARELYGQRSRAPFLAALQQRLAQALGPGHEVTLLVLRARIFAARQLERPAEALALSDDFAALVQAHQADDPRRQARLRMANRSERVGALAGLGRLADARDEGLLLLQDLQRQQPVPHANIMRSAYNLAALHIDMADFDGAATYAQLSIDAALASGDLHAASEVLLPRIQLQQARVLRGDPGAVGALQQALRDSPTGDLPLLSPLRTLWQAAGAAGQDGQRGWAREQLGRLVAEHASPLQAARGMPLLLDADDAPAGADDGLDAAARATAVALASADPAGAVLAQFALGRQAAPRQPAGAIWACKRAALGLLAWRRALPAGAESAQQALMASHDGPLRACIGLLIDQGRLAEAEQAIAVLREEELHEFRRRSRGAPPTQRSARGLSLTPDEQRRDAALAPLQATLQAQAAEARARADRHAVWQERMRAGDPQADAALADGAAALQRLVLADAPAAAGTASGVDRGDRAAPMARLPAGHLRVTYLVRPAALELLWQQGLRRGRITVPVAAVDLNRGIQALRVALQQPGDGVPAPARQLHRWLIQPLLEAPGGDAPQPAGLRHLQLRPDAALRYVPFAALHDGRQYLVERLSLNVEPDGSPAAAPGGPAAASSTPRIAGFGRSLPDAAHSALPGVRDELAVLGGLRGARVQLAQDGAFTAQALGHGLAQRPAVVHLASHFVLDAAGEEASYLLLGDGERLPLRALRQLPWQGVRLAMLSACDSGLAVADGAPGREWSGFAATLQAAGVPHVVAALWRIDDAGTARWMRQFYAPWQHPGAAPPLQPARLAEAQRRWLRQHRGTPLAHPHHWAAFQWLGRA